MADAWHLSLDFVEEHPAEAARVLEGLPGAHAAAFLASLPPATGARLLAALLPSAAARVVSASAPASAVALLHATGTQSSVAILRHVAQPTRAALLAGLPAATAAASQLLLGFADDTVGAWTDPDVPALRPELDVAAALARTRESGTAGLHHVYVVDGSGRLLGAVALESLIAAPPRDTLGHVMRPVPATLAVMMPIAVACELPAWRQALALPVVDHDRRLLGVLRLSALAQAMRTRIRASTEPRGAPSVASALAGSYWGVVAALASALLALLPHVTRVTPEE